MSHRYEWSLARTFAAAVALSLAIAFGAIGQETPPPPPDGEPAADAPAGPAPEAPNEEAPTENGPGPADSPSDQEGSLPPPPAEEEMADDMPQGDAATACTPCPQTVWVRRTFTEVREVPVTKYRTETREREYTVYRNVPETQTVSRTRTVMTPVARTRTVEYTVCEPRTETKEVSYTVMVRTPRTETVEYTVARPVWETKQQEYTVLVPHTEVRQGTRRVCEAVPVTRTKTVCRWTGRWEDRPYAVAGCHPKGCPPACGAVRQSCVEVRRCWVPEVTYEQVPYTTYEARWKEVPYEYPVTVCRPETRVRDVQVCRMVHETKSKDVTRFDYTPEERTRSVQQTRYVNVPKTREVEYTEYVPEEIEEQVEVTRYRRVAEKKTATYEVCVPYTEIEEREFQVCRLVQETRQVCAQPAVCGSYADTCQPDCGVGGACDHAPRRRGLLRRLSQRH